MKKIFNVSVGNMSNCNLIFNFYFPGKDYYSVKEEINQIFVGIDSKKIKIVDVDFYYEKNPKLQPITEAVMLSSILKTFDKIKDQERLTKNNILDLHHEISRQEQKSAHIFEIQGLYWKQLIVKMVEDLHLLSSWRANFNKIMTPLIEQENTEIIKNTEELLKKINKTKNKSNHYEK